MQKVPFRVNPRLNTLRNIFIKLIKLNTKNKYQISKTKNIQGDPHKYNN